MPANDYHDSILVCDYASMVKNHVRYQVVDTIVED